MEQDNFKSVAEIKKKVVSVDNTVSKNKTKVIKMKDCVLIEKNGKKNMVS